MFLKVIAEEIIEGQGETKLAVVHGTSHFSILLFLPTQNTTNCQEIICRYRLAQKLQWCQGACPVVSLGSW